MKLVEGIRVMAILLMLSAIGVSCKSDSGSKGSKDSPGNYNTDIIVPTEISAAAQSVQDISAMDIAEISQVAPPGFSGSPLEARESTASGTLPPGLLPSDARWLWVIHPLRRRGRDDLHPRMIEPLIAARFVKATTPTCATIGFTGTCPPDTLTLGSSCTTTITFAAGCTVTGTVGSAPYSLILTGTLNVVTSITQIGTWPAIKSNTTVTTTDFQIAEPSGAAILYKGTISEDYDSTTPASGFTLVQTSPAIDPITLIEANGYQLSTQGTRTITIVPNNSLQVVSAGTIVITNPLFGPATYQVSSTKTVAVGATDITLTLNRTITDPLNNQYQRAANLKLTPTGSPVTSMTVNGTQTFQSPTQINAVNVINVVLDMACFAPSGGTMVITTPVQVIAVTFSATCSCAATWSSSTGFSGMVDICRHIDLS